MAKTLSEKLKEKKMLKQSVKEHESGHKLSRAERGSVVARFLKKKKHGKS